MRMVPVPAPAFVLILSLSACGLFPPRLPDSGPQTGAAAEAPPGAAAGPVPVSVPVSGQSAAALDAATEAERAAAVAAPAQAGTELGKVTVSLGSPADPGFWLKTALVKLPARGRVVLASGKSVAVNLVPVEGAAVLSYSAYRALGLALTDLPLVTVLAE